MPHNTKDNRLSNKSRLGSLTGIIDYFTGGAASKLQGRVKDKKTGEVKKSNRQRILDSL